MIHSARSVEKVKTNFSGMKGVLGGNHQGFPLNCDHSLKIEAEQSSVRFLFFGTSPKKRRQLVGKPRFSKVFRQAERSVINIDNAPHIACIDLFNSGVNGDFYGFKQVRGLVG